MKGNKSCRENCLHLKKDNVTTNFVVVVLSIQWSTSVPHITWSNILSCYVKISKRNSDNICALDEKTLAKGSCFIPLAFIIESNVGDKDAKPCCIRKWLLIPCTPIKCHVLFPPFFTDRENLNDQEAVAKTQTKFLHALRMQLLKNHRKDPLMFAKVLLTLPILRTVDDLHNQFIMQLKIGVGESNTLPMPQLYKEVYDLPSKSNQSRGDHNNHQQNGVNKIATTSSSSCLKAKEENKEYSSCQRGGSSVSPASSLNLGTSSSSSSSSSSSHFFRPTCHLCPTLADLTRPVSTMLPTRWALDTFQGSVVWVWVRDTGPAPHRDNVSRGYRSVCPISTTHTAVHSATNCPPKITTFVITWIRQVRYTVPWNHGVRMSIVTFTFWVTTSRKSQIMTLRAYRACHLPGLCFSPAHRLEAFLGHARKRNSHRKLMAFAQ